MKQISGRVIVTESRLGIPDLTVAAYDVSERLGSGSPTAAGAEPGVRLGTVVTDDDGRFALRVTSSASETSSRPVELVVVVRVPEDAGQSDRTPLYTSTPPRRSVATAEEFLVTIGSDALMAAGVTPPAGSASPAVERPAAAVRSAQATLERSGELRADLRNLATVEVDRTRERIERFDTGFRTALIDELTGPGTAEPGYIASDAPYDELRSANWDAVARSANLPKPPVAGYIQVPADEVPPDFPAVVGVATDADTETVERYLFGSGSDLFRATERSREDPVALARQRKQQQDLLTEALETPPAPGTPGPPEPPVPPEPPAATTPADLPRFVHRLMDGMAPPDAPPVEQRPDHAGVQHETDTFSLRGGPADVPAVYDFHNLQIAFDHVWTQAVDEDVIQLSGELFHALREAGADPEGAVSRGVRPVWALRAETRLVGKAVQPVVPTAMARKNSGPGSTTGPIGGGPFDPGSVLDPMPPMPPIPPIPPKPIPPGGWGPVAWPPTRVQLEEAYPKQPHELLDALERLLMEQYKFEVFAPGSVNFGLNVTYRQRWVPLTYQVGDLVKTITLTPRESRKVSAKRVRRKERMVREMEDSLQVRKAESADQGRDESEIVRKAQGKTNFGLAAEGSYNLGIASGDSKTTFTKDAADESADTKKAFREAVLKAAQEYKDERKLEVESKEYEEAETTETTEITNPNDELTVTYLFYELQRRFHISEQLHRIRPVVLVGMEVPNPSHAAIDRVLITHSWIINRLLLDDRYRPALTYLTTKIVGDELALRERLTTVNRLRTIVDAAERHHAELVNEVKTRNAHLEAMMELRAKKVDEEAQGGLWDSFTDFVVGEGEGEDLEAVRIREENARAHYEKSVRTEQELRESLRSDTAAMTKATADYAHALAEHSNRLLEVSALRLHFKANVLFYMQGIWSHTFRDQLYFSMHKLKVPTLKSAELRYQVERLEAPPAHVVPRPGHVPFKVTATRTFATPSDPADPVDPAEDKTLAEVADLDNPLGFKGNYMVFPLKRSNALTDFMMTPYIDEELGLHDPDELGSWTPGDFVEHVTALRNTMTPAAFDEILPILTEQYRRIVSAPRRPEDEIVVPSASLYVEALPGKHPNLEDFKLRHRAVDVSKARAEVRRIELENVRYASRVLAAEREDPEIDKQIRIQGGGSVIVPPEV